MAIDFSISELVALSVESFVFGALPPSCSYDDVVSPPSAFAGIYFVLFCSSFKLLLNKRTISGVTPLLAFASVLGALITWVSNRRIYTFSLYGF